MRFGGVFLTPQAYFLTIWCLGYWYHYFGCQDPSSWNSVGFLLDHTPWKLTWKIHHFRLYFAGKHLGFFHGYAESTQRWKAMLGSNLFLFKFELVIFYGFDPMGFITIKLTTIWRIPFLNLTAISHLKIGRNPPQKDWNSSSFNHPKEIHHLPTIRRNFIIFWPSILIILRIAMFVLVFVCF